MTIQSDQVDVERYWRAGYLTAPVLSADHLAQRAESDRLLQLCTVEHERYARRIQWEADHLAERDRADMERVIRKLEPISDISPLFRKFAFSTGIVSQVGAIFGESVELFEDKLNFKRRADRPTRGIRIGHAAGARTPTS